MSALAFIHSLLDSGGVRVNSSIQPPGDLAEAVRELDRRARPHLPSPMPQLLAEPAEWALLILYRACQALVYREIKPAAITAVLSTPCPAAPSPAACYSVDLAFNFLSDLIRLARGIADDDPLVIGLMSLAKQWPLSSVGVSGLGDIDIDPFITHRGLRRVYADRVIAKTDVSRLTHRAARDAIREALGAFPQLAPELAARMQPTEMTR